MKSPAPRLVSALVDAEGAERVFEDRGELGRGGMGSVRLAWDPRLLRHTALKIVDPANARVDLVPRFVEEAQITGQLEHPHIVPVHEFGVDTSGCMYLSLKLVEGETLWKRVRRLGDARLERDALGDLIQVLLKVCEAVAYAHDRGVVHRDIKPANVMCGSFGQVYLLDWGIACLVPGEHRDPVRTSRVGEGTLDQPDALVGTPSWMAPEQAMAEHDLIDARTDVWALGALLYFVLAGRAPYAEGDTRRTVMNAQLGRFKAPSALEGMPPIPAQLERIALKAMARDPVDRYANAQELAGELQRFLRGTWSFPTARFPAGAAVVRQGDAGDRAYVVQHGRLEVVKESADGPIVVRALGPGDCFGEMSVFTEAPRSATVVARTDVELLVVTRDALRDGLGLNTWMGAFVTALAERFAEADERLRGSHAPRASGPR